jgi:chromosome segregation ATPase
MSGRDQLELDELARLREEVSLAQEQLKCAKDNAARWEAEVRAAKDVAAERKKMVVGRDDTGGDEVDMVTMLSELLIEARMSAAQYAFERDEAKGQAQRLQAEVERLGNAVRQLQEHTTRLEAKYDAEHKKYAKLEAKHKAVCQRYEGDVAGLIELRAQADEANRQLSLHESKLGMRRGVVGFEGGC